MNVSQQCALAAMKTKCALVCVSKSTASRLRKVIITVSSALVRLNLGSPVQDRHHHTGASTVRALSFFSLKRRPGNHPIAVFNYLIDKEKTEPDPFWRCSAKG